MTPQNTAQLSSVKNALRVLHILRRNGPKRITEIAAELGVGNSTAHRIVKTLQAEHFVAQEMKGRKYALGSAMLFTAGTSALEHCVTTALPVMSRLRDTIQETVHLSTIRGTEVIFLASSESTRQLRVTTRLGEHPAAHTTAVGKVLLAALSNGSVAELYPEVHSQNSTPCSETEFNTLLSEIETAKTLGYARNICESEDDIYTIAVPLQRPGGAVVCALAISSPISRVNATRGAELTQAEIGYLTSLINAKHAVESRLAF